VREGAIIGEECILGKGAYVDRDVRIGNRVKIENRASLFRGLTVEDGVFIGPHVCFTNDRYPRAVKPDGSSLSDSDWRVVPTKVLQGASIGAGAVVLPGVTIGRWALIGAGALVTHDVPDHALALGHPARVVGWVCRCGRPLAPGDSADEWICPMCHETYRLPTGTYLASSGQHGGAA
jgi:acetyltransferase-like isoleucine patch superfamily enzyme